MNVTDYLKRSRRNIAANLRFARHRRERRRQAPVVSTFELVEIAAIAIVSVALAALLLDAPIATYRGQYPDWLWPTVGVLTRLGKSDWILIPSGIVLILLTFRNLEALSTLGRMRVLRWNLFLSWIFVGVGLPSLVSTIVKRILGRARPEHFAEDGLFGLSPFTIDASYAAFPSGHATTVGALAMALVLVFPRYRAFLLIAALVLGATRVAVGAHYPSDVVGGLIFGAVTTYVLARIAAGHGLLFLDNPGGWPRLRPAFRPKRLLE